ncbi:hypothetical protein F4677DRAFT_444665 [Hypoxylon crocopeplum]|nr:hypothetical protein F4677DRAFT_444665 [Hypoxylon crocopeplum]
MATPRIGLQSKNDRALYLLSADDISGNLRCSLKSSLTFNLCSLGMTDHHLWPQLEDRTLVYDPRVAQVTIKKTKKVDNDSNRYWTIPLNEPTKKDSDCWDLFIDSNGEKVSAQKPEQIPKDGYLIARLNLQTLGVKGRLFRKYKKLQTVYILKPENNSTSDGYDGNDTEAT